MKTVLITGGTGLIGKALTKMLVDRGYKVLVLTRGRKADGPDGVSYCHWDVTTQEIDRTAIQQADYIVHLAGANVGEKRWSARRKKEIVDSRTKTGDLIVKALRETPNQVKAVISSSAIGWYGPDHEEHPFTESDPPANDFLGRCCQQWEQSIEPVTELGKRLVKIRTGIVLSNDGGAFVSFKKPARAGLATVLGSGRQVISWVHIHDICRIFLFALENDNIRGIFNGVAPMPASNQHLARTLATQLKGKFFITIFVPRFLLRWLLGEMSIEVLKSCKVSAQKLKAAGFQFTYPTLEAALNELVPHKHPQPPAPAK